MQERTQMRDKIDRLESEGASGHGKPSALGENEDNKVIEKLSRKLKNREYDLQQTKSEFIEAKNQIAKA